MVPTTICRFVNRSINEKGLTRRKKLKGKNINNINNNYINVNLNTYYKMLSAKGWRLMKSKLISDTWTFKGIPRIIK